METVADYFSFGLNTTADYLVLSSLIVFIVGLIAIRFEEMQINRKSSYYFYLAIILFGTAIYMGWNDYDILIHKVWESL